MRPNGELPSDHHADRRKAHLLSIVPPRAQGSRRCETQASLRRQAAKAPLAFRSLDPFRALREPDCRRRDEKRPFPLRTKNFSATQKQPLDRKSPIQVCKPSVPPREIRIIPEHGGEGRLRPNCAIATSLMHERGREQRVRIRDIDDAVALPPSWRA